MRCHQPAPAGCRGRRKWRACRPAAWAGLEGDQTDTIPNVKLKHVATIVESLIAIWSPHDAFRMNRFSKLRQGDTEMAFVLLLRIKSVAESICDLSSIRLARERGGVTSSHGNAPSYFIKGAFQHRTIW